MEPWLANLTALALDALPWGVLVCVTGIVVALGVTVSRGSPADDDVAEPGAYIFGPLTPALAAMLPDLFTRKIQRDLRRCGFNHPRAYENYRALRNVLSAGTLFTAGCWLVALADASAQTTQFVVVGGIVAVVLVYSLPRLYVSWRGERRAHSVVVGFPDALDVTVMSLTGGLPLLAALDRAGDEIRLAHPDLADELKILRRQSHAASLEFALRRLAERMDVDEVTTLATLVSHAERLGSNVGHVLRDYADELRRTRMQRATERGNKASVKMLFPIVLCLAPATYIVLLAPPLLKLQKFRDDENKQGGALAQPDLGKAKTARPRSPRTTPRPPQI